MASWSMISMQNSASPIMEQLIFFHDYSMMILTMITSLVLYLMINMFMNNLINRNLLHGQLIEIIWTIMPSIILLFMALPSLRILYMMDEMNNPLITVKTMGHQWYWTYEYSNLYPMEFDSYMMPTNSLNTNNFRLLEVDNRLILPMKSNIHMLVTAADVIHSWTVPSLAVKVDGTPGRLNQTNFNIHRSGLFYGQCSEICGMNHSFMPIVIESIPMNKFINWTKTM